ncbi:MAG: DUF1638 domain-containing protein [Actinomycetota bacterium]
MQPRPLDDEVTFEAGTPASNGPAGRVLVVACGAIAREVLAVIDLNGWTHVTLRCLPGKLHNTPREIAGKVDAELTEAEASGGYDAMFVAYGDCGTAGALDDVLAAHGVDRLPGDHCYGFFAGVDEFAAMHEDNPFTFYLTDFLCRHFDRLVVRGLKLDSHPELLPMVFGNYRRLVYLSQIDDPALVEQGKAAAAFLGLEFEHRPSGYGDLRPSLESFVEGVPRGR